MSRKRQQKKIHKMTAMSDIRYRGPLNYQHFQILGWLCIVISQVLLALRLLIKLDSSFAEQYASMQGALEWVSEMSLPLLLIANFAQILDDSRGYRKQLVKNIAASLLVFGLSNLLFHRYVAGSLAGITLTPENVEPALEEMIREISPTRFVSFNLFIDLLMCTLVMLFLNYQPKRVFRGKLLHVFRLFALLPIAYEIICMVLKVQCAKGYISLPFWSFPLLTVKPPMTFVLFILLAVFIKTRELRFRRHGKTQEEYKAFLRTNRNSLNFSVFLAVMIIVVSAVDFVVFTGYSAISTVKTLNSISAQTTENGETDPNSSEQEVPKIAADDAVTEGSPAEAEKQKSTQEMDELTMAIILAEANTAIALGFGGSLSLIGMIPLVLLFSYNKKPRFEKAGMFIPAGGIVLILFLYLEAARLVMQHLPIDKMQLSEIVRTLTDVLGSLE